MIEGWVSGCGRGGGLSRCRQARLLVGLDVHLAVQHSATDIQKLGAYPFAAPALEARLADVPANSQLLLVKVNNSILVSFRMSWQESMKAIPESNPRPV